jgi:uncharacterized membrane protein (UPF0136 family)
MNQAAAALTLLYGAVSVVGGILGYVRAGSTPSLVAGSLAGVLLLVTGAVVAAHRGWGLVLAVAVSVALVGRFLPAYLRTRSVWPALIIAALGAATIVLSIAALATRQHAHG